MQLTVPFETCCLVHDIPLSVIKCVACSSCTKMVNPCSSLVQNSPMDVTMGPYETYKDGLFGYKVNIGPFSRTGDQQLHSFQLKGPCCVSSRFSFLEFLSTPLAIS
jgi:hypothetical protein